MKSAKHWTDEVLIAVSVLTPAAQLIHEEPFYMIRCNTANIYMHLVSLEQPFIPVELIAVQERYLAEGKFLIHVWEDVWYRHKYIVLDRMKSILGMNTTIYARSTYLMKLTAKEAREFLQRYHLQGFVHAKYFYGLFLNSELLVVAAFSHLRPMLSKGSHYRSAELVRFASKSGFTITGGLSRLIKHFIRETGPDDLMTYADRDWSAGVGYARLGFVLTGVSDPIYLCVDQADYSRHYLHRMHYHSKTDLNAKEAGCPPGFSRIFTTGNLKYYLYCK